MNALPVVLVVGAYLLGAIPVGYLVGRLRGVDITKVGSGNIGATNVLRVLGKGPGIAVLALDVAKGLVPPLVLLQATQSKEWALAAGVSAVVGHCLSPFLTFRGGKGIATGLGMLIGVTPVGAAVAFGVFAAVLAGFRYVSLASIFATWSVVATSLATGDSVAVVAVFVVVALFVTYRHRTNIQRLIDGTEPRFGRASAEEGHRSPEDENQSGRTEQPSG
ncbi:MAG: glycerol-3-phosphate 1-O-acyltransferase PlsY [Fimbriimonadaceae bacterium]